MGYTTSFNGKINLDRKLAPEHAEYLRAFSNTRRMERRSNVANQLPDPIRKAAGLPIGRDAEYFVGGTGLCGQDCDDSIVNYNSPPNKQPALWCQWVPSDDGKAIVWDGGEKFYNYVEWLEYIIDHFLKLWDYELNGEIEWRGEDMGDRGKIIVQNNNVTIEDVAISIDDKIKCIIESIYWCDEDTIEQMYNLMG